MSFKPEMRNIPLWSLREEFCRTLEIINSNGFESALRNRQVPIPIVLFEWYGGTQDLLSLLVQRSILGIESYTVGAAWIKLNELGLMTKQINEMVRNPFSIKRGTGTAESYYCDLPSLVHEDLSLARVDPEFWLELKRFYRDVRNPLFHGYQFESADLSNVRRSLWYLSEIYAWLDQWYPPESERGNKLGLLIGSPSA